MAAMERATDDPRRPDGSAGVPPAEPTLDPPQVEPEDDVPYVEP
jgi:hypothetical protein